MAVLDVYKKQGIKSANKTTIKNSGSSKINVESKYDDWAKKIEEAKQRKQLKMKYEEEVAKYEAYQEEQKKLAEEQAEKDRLIAESNVFERTGATLLDFGVNLGKGFLGGVEGIVDLVAGLDKDNKEFVEQDLSSKWLKDLGINEQGNYNKISYLEDEGLGEQIAQATGQMLPAIIPYVGMPYVISSSMGGGVEEAYKNDATYEQALLYGGTVGTIEGLTEKLFNTGVMNKLFGKGFLDDVVKKVGKSTAGRFVSSMAQEGFEEVISEAVTPVARWAIYEKSQGKEIDWASASELTQAFVVGGITSGIFNTGNNAIIKARFGNVEVYNAAQDVSLAYQKAKQLELNNELFGEKANKVFGEINDANLTLENALKKQAREYTLENGVKSLDTTKQRKLVSKIGGALEDFNFQTQKFETLPTNFEYVENAEGVKYQNADKSVTIDLSKKVSKDVQQVAQEGYRIYKIFNEKVGDGTKIIFTDKIAGNGNYDFDTKTLTIKVDENTTNQDVFNEIIGHEFTHSLEGTKEYEKLRNEIKDKIISKNSKHSLKKFFPESNKLYDDIVDLYLNSDETGQELKDLQERQQLARKNKRLGKEYVESDLNAFDRYIEEEVVASFIGKNLFTNQDYINSLSKENYSLFQKLKSWINKKLKRVKDIENVTNEVQVKEVRKFLEKAKQLYNNALEGSKVRPQELNILNKKTNKKYSLKREVKNTETVREALDIKPYFSQEAQDLIKTDKLVYEMVSNRDTIVSARKELEGKPLHEALEKTLKELTSGKLVTEVTIAKGYLLMHKCSGTPSLAYAVLDLRDAIGLALTQAGRTAQAGALFAKMTREGRIETFIRRAKRNAETLTEENANTKGITNKTKTRVTELLSEAYDKDIKLIQEVSVTQVLSSFEMKVDEVVTITIPEEVQKTIVKELNKYPDFNQEIVKEKVSNTLKEQLPTITDEQIENISKDIINVYERRKAELDNLYEKGKVVVPIYLQERLRQAEDEKEARIIEKEIQAFMDAQKQIGLYEKIQQWRYLAMLANPKTHIRNMVSNEVTSSIYSLKDSVVALIEKVIKVPQGERTSSLKKVTTAKISYGQDLANEVFDEIKTKSSKYNSKNENVRIFETEWLEKVRKLNSNLLELVEDKKSFVKTFANKFSRWATANNYTVDYLKSHPIIRDKGMAYATQQALEATFKDFSGVVQKLNEIKAKNKIADFFLSSIIPFTKTPVNVAKRALEFSPLNLIKTLTYDYKKLKNNKLSATKFVDNLAKGLTGSMITLLGMVLAKMGLVTGGDDEDEKYQSYSNNLGGKAFSIKIGDKLYTLDWLAPASIPFFTGVECFKLLDKDYNLEDVDISALGDIILKTLDPLTEMSFIRSLNQALSSYEGNKIAGVAKNALTSFVTSLFPTLGSQLAKTLSPEIKTTQGTKDSKYLVNYIKSKIPFLNFYLEPYVDVWGNTKESNPNFLERIGENFFFPYTTYENKMTEVDKNILELYNQTKDSSIIPSTPKYYYTENGEKVEMTNEEYTEFKINYGSFNYNNLQALFLSNFYQNLSIEEKINAINKVYSLGKQYAKKDYFYSLSNVMGNNPQLGLYITNISNIKNDVNISNKKQAVFDYINSQKLSKDKKNLLYFYSGYTDNNKKDSVINFLKEQDLSQEELDLLLEKLKLN